MKQIEDEKFADLLKQVPEGYELVIPRKESPYFRKKFRLEKQFEHDISS